MPEKTLSVIMPNYNDADFIGVSLKAICEQSLPPTEVLVIDNCSTDNSIAVIKEIAAKYPFIRLLQNDTNRGCIYSCNKAAKLVTGDYLHVASANDLVYPGFFEKSMLMLSKYPDAGLCFTDCTVITVKDGTTIDSSWMPAGGYVSPRQVAEITGSNPNWYVCAAATNSIIRRDLLGPDYLYNPDIDAFGDLFLSQLLMFRYGCCYVPEPLAAVRLSENSYSENLIKDKVRFQALCVKLIQLFASVEYEDITPLIIRSRLMRIINFRMRTPGTVFTALCTMRKCNRYAAAMFFHLVGEYFNNLCTYSIEGRIYLLARLIKQHTQDACFSAFCFLKNMCDRVYATTFHKYDMARTVVRKQLGL